jgi:hypothetical protein
MDKKLKNEYEDTFIHIQPININDNQNIRSEKQQIDSNKKQNKTNIKFIQADKYIRFV